MLYLIIAEMANRPTPHQMEALVALKKLCQQWAQSMRRTGGGFDVVPELSLLELRLVAVMGGDSFAGSRGLAVCRTVSAE